MRVEYAFVAEAADTQAGLFYVTRGGADIYTFPPDLPRPMNLGSIAFVVRVSGDPEDVGQAHQLRFVIVDSGGQALAFQQQAEARFERHPFDPQRATGNVMAFRLFGLPVPDFGAYAFEVHAGDERLATVPFWVVRAGPDGGAPASESDAGERDSRSDEPGGYL